MNFLKFVYTTRKKKERNEISILYIEKKNALFLYGKHYNSIKKLFARGIWTSNHVLMQMFYTLASLFRNVNCYDFWSTFLILKNKRWLMGSITLLSVWIPPNSFVFCAVSRRLMRLPCCLWKPLIILFFYIFVFLNYTSTLILKSKFRGTVSSHCF
jgi:hypothetical protein